MFLHPFLFNGYHYMNNIIIRIKSYSLSNNIIHTYKDIHK